MKIYWHGENLKHAWYWEYSWWEVAGAHEHLLEVVMVEGINGLMYCRSVMSLGTCQVHAVTMVIYWQ